MAPAVFLAAYSLTLSSVLQTRTQMLHNNGSTQMQMWCSKESEKDVLQLYKKRRRKKKFRLCQLPTVCPLIEHTGADRQAAKEAGEKQFFPLFASNSSSRINWHSIFRKTKAKIAGYALLLVLTR